MKLLLSVGKCLVRLFIINGSVVEREPDLERDLELERRKTRDLQEASRERDKEYQKLKVSALMP